MEPGLYIVPTPIGNLADVSQRSLDVLGGVSLIAAEDTRHTARLLKHFGIGTTLFPYHDHNEREGTEQLLLRLEEGASVALVCDAGTPLVSDPGYRLVRGAQDHGIRVMPLPGPCAAVVALSASGLPTDRFHFEGFLPAKSTARSARLRDVANYQSTLIFYEAPHRIVATLEDAAAILGSGREAVLGRELTKAFETIHRAPLVELLAWVKGDPDQQRGEQVLLVGPAPAAPEGQLTDREHHLLIRLGEELPPRKAAALAADLTGHKARTLYNLLLQRQE